MNVELTYTENLVNVSVELNLGSFTCEVWASSDVSSAESIHRVPSNTSNLSINNFVRVCQWFCATVACCLVPMQLHRDNAAYMEDDSHHFLWVNTAIPLLDVLKQVLRANEIHTRPRQISRSTLPTLLKTRLHQW